MVGAKSLQLSFLLFLLMSAPVLYASPSTGGGELDLGSLSSNGQISVPIQGDWLVHVERFVDAEHEAYGRPDLIIRNPRDISGYQYGKDSRVPVDGYATLSLELRLPNASGDKRWAIELPRSSSSARWEARGYDEDGHPLGESFVALGTVATTAANVEASRAGGYLFLPTAKHVVLNVKVANRHAGHLGFEQLPVFGDYDELVGRNLWFLFVNAGILGVLLVIGLYHLAIFLIRPTESAPFWLAVFSLVLGIGFSLHVGVLEQVFGFDFDFVFAMRLGAICFPVLALAGVMLLSHLIPGFMSANSRSVMMGLAASVMGMILVAQPSSLDGAINFLGQALCFSVFALWMFVTLIGNTFTDSQERTLLRAMGWVTVLSFVADFVDPPLAVGEIGLSFGGLVCWLTALSFVLASRNNEARTLMVTLSAELELKNQELSELDQLKDDFLAKTSHELRTPLNGIIGLSESLLDGVGGPLEPRLRRNVGMIEQSGKRLSHLVNDILDFSKLRNRRITLDRIPVNLFSAVEMVVELSRPLIGDKKMDVYNVVSKDLTLVLADPNRLQQILFNLVGNAIKFTEQGYVTIKADLDQQKQRVNVSVEDSGVGIALEYRERIFRAFEQGDGSTQREHGGTGLGLAVSRELVLAHGGELEVASALGMGTTMSFSLPVADLGDTSVQGHEWKSRPVERVEAPITEQNTSSPDGDEVGQTVLVIDDEAVNREVVALQMQAEGFPVVALESGKQAIDWVKEHGAPAVLLLDVMMPGLSGLDVLVELRKQYSLQELPVLLLTARGTDQDMVEGFAAGANDYLVKPFSRPELLNRLKHHLGFSAMSSMLRSTNQLLESELSKRHSLEGSLAQMRLRQDNAEQELADLQAGLDVLAERVSGVKAKLLQAEKLASLGQMMAGIARSLGQPVVSISERLTSFREQLDESVAKVVPYLEREHADAEAFQESLELLKCHIENIEAGVDMILKITRAMMNYDAEQLEDHEDTHLGNLVQDCLAICGFRLKGVDVQLQLDDESAVSVHRTHLAQVISNLISNAVDAMSEQSDEGTESKVLRVSTESQTKNGQAGVLVSVEDNGKGVPEDLREDIFKPFFTTKDVGRGTGIGLAVSKRIVDDHAGDIAVTSSESLGGARFKVWLPSSGSFAEAHP